MDLATTRRNLRQRLSVYRVDGCMPVPTATLTALLDALDVADADVAQYRSLAKAAIESDMESLTRLDAATRQSKRSATALSHPRPQQRCDSCSTG